MVVHGNRIGWIFALLVLLSIGLPSQVTALADTPEHTGAVAAAHSTVSDHHRQHTGHDPADPANSDCCGASMPAACTIQLSGCCNAAAAIAVGAEDMPVDFIQADMPSPSRQSMAAAPPLSSDPPPPRR